MPLMPLIIGMAGGLASAVLFYSAVRGSIGLSIILFLLTPLPSLITGFGWGLAAASAGAIAGAIVMAITVGQTFGIGYFLALGPPIILATHLITLVRYDGDNRISRVVSRRQHSCGHRALWRALPILVAPLFGGSYQILEADMLKYLQRLAQQAPLGSGWRMAPEQMQRVARFWIDALPAALASYWTLFFVLNAYIAARVTQASALLPRPATKLSRIVLPPVLVLVFAAAVAAIFYPGETRIIGASVIGALFIAFLIMGFTVAHAAGQTRAKWVTPAAYATAVLANGIALPMIAGVGLGETAFRFRDKLLPPGDPPKAPPPPSA